MKSASQVSSVKSSGENKRHESPVVAPRFATAGEGMGKHYTLSKCTENYVVVDEDSERLQRSESSGHGSAKSIPSASATPVGRAPNPGGTETRESGQVVTRLTRGMGRAAQKRQEVRVFMAAADATYDVKFAKASATAGTISLFATQFVDWTNFKAEYDEVFFEKVRVRMTVWPNVGSNSSSIAIGHQYFAIAWEPYDNGTPGSSLNLASNRFTTGLQYMPVLVYSTSGTANTSSSFAVANWPAPPKYFTVIGKPPPYGKSKIDQRPSQMQDAAHAADGNWHSVNISNLTFGYIKYYFGDVTVSGDASNFTASYLVEATMRFRSRTG